MNLSKSKEEIDDAGDEQDTDGDVYGNWRGVCFLICLLRYFVFTVPQNSL